MAVIPIGEPGRKLRKRIAANRAHLFVFITNRDVPYTNNVSERNLRPSVIFRKVTNGFRCEWGAETYAAFRSVVSTAKVNRRSSSTTYARCWAARHTAGPSPSRGEQLQTIKIRRIIYAPFGITIFDLVQPTTIARSYKHIDKNEFSIISLQV